MNILVLDKDKISLQSISIIEKIEKNVKIIIVSNFENGLEIYKSNNIDALIVDYSFKECKKLLEDILKIEPFISRYFQQLQAKKSLHNRPLYSCLN